MSRPRMDLRLNQLIFKSGAYAQNAVSFAIDQSVYVAQKKLITKYTSGLQDGFSPTYPDSGPSITRVMTGGDVDLSIYMGQI